MNDVSTKNRARILRRQATSLGLMMIQRGELFIITNAMGDVVLTGDIGTADEFISARFQPKAFGPPPMAIPAAWEPWVDALISEMRAARRSPGTVRLRRLALARFARSRLDLDPLTVTRSDLLEYLANDSWAPRYANNVRSTFRVFFEMLQQGGHRADNPAERLPEIQIPRSVPRPCPDVAISETFSVIEDPVIRLALRIAAETGMRRAEIARIRRCDVEGSPGAYWLRVIGKAGHERTVPIADDLAVSLMNGVGPYAFPSRDKWGNVLGEHISAAHLGKLLAKALPDNWTVHTLRHRFGTKAYEATKDIRAVQELMGHASPATTAIYTRVANESLRIAANAARLT